MRTEIQGHLRKCPFAALQRKLTSYETRIGQLEEELAGKTAMPHINGKRVKGAENLTEAEVRH
jgi:hypothetical protein